MNNFLNSMEKVASYKTTENGAFALNATLDKTLDLFGTIGALRERDSEDIISMFLKAYAENRELALKMLFYTRDCRGGLGEKKIFKIIVKYLAVNHTEDIKKNLQFIPEFGRWDDLYEFVGTALEDEAFELMKTQFDADRRNMFNKKSVSSLAKWLKSINTSSEESRRLGRLTAKKFGYSERLYRKSLAELRKYINVVETKMSASKWADIKYEMVPSYAAKNYSAAFMKHDEERYSDYLSAVKNGTAKINASVLFPYDIIRKYTKGLSFADVDETTEAQWKALPDYVAESKKKFLVMADTSGSMMLNDWLPINTSVSLAVYFAERNKGDFHGKFITFTDEPRFVDLPDNLSLLDKTKIVLDRKYVGYNTNLEAAFELVLNAAKEGNVSQEELPDAILVISDMEIDSFGTHNENTSFTEEMEVRFEEAGYKMPTLVYWNVNARANTFHASINKNVRFVSGSSASIFKGLCENMGYSAVELMINTLNSERYSCITCAN